MKRHALLSAAAILLTAAAANAQLASKITHYDVAKPPSSRRCMTAPAP